MKPFYGFAAYIPETNRLIFDSTCTTQTDILKLTPYGQHAHAVRVKVVDNESRSLPASALFHIWCDQLGGFMGEDSNTVKQILKIKYGWPILRENIQMWSKLRLLFKGAGWRSLSYSEKIEFAEIIPCTRIMTTNEMSRFMDAIKNMAMTKYNIELNNRR